MNHQTETVDMKVAGSASTRVALADLKVDTGYARPLDEAWVREIAAGFYEQLFLPLVVNRRPSGDLYVVDGQHRLEVARIAGATHVWATVLETDPANEPMLFLMTNKHEEEGDDDDEF